MQFRELCGFSDLTPYMACHHSNIPVITPLLHVAEPVSKTYMVCVSFFVRICL